MYSIKSVCALTGMAAGLMALTACSGVSVHTNLDPENFTEYYKPSTVEVTTYEELGNTPYVHLGTLSGLSCQVKSDDFPANASDARTDLRRKAADAGANALVPGKCVTAKDTGACSISVTCYGDALLVEDK